MGSQARLCQVSLPSTPLENRHFVMCLFHSTIGVTAYIGLLPNTYHRHPTHTFYQSQDGDSEKSKSWTSHISQVEGNELQWRVGGLESWPQTRQNSLIFNTWPSFQRHTQAHQPTMGFFSIRQKSQVDSKKYIHCRTIRQRERVLGALGPCGQYLGGIHFLMVNRFKHAICCVLISQDLFSFSNFQFWQPCFLFLDLKKKWHKPVFEGFYFFSCARPDDFKLIYIPLFYSIKGKKKKFFFFPPTGV